MDIEKLCEEFHEKVGKDKKIKIFVLEGDTETEEIWFTGKADGYRPSLNNPKKPKPFMKLTKGLGIEYSYVIL